MTTRTHFEHALLADPFNSAMRGEYATLLLDEGDATAALTQFELATRQSGDAATLVGMARAQLALDRETEALATYRRAREHEGFVADAELAKLEQSARPAGGPTLAIVGGTHKVVPIKAAEANAVRFDDIGGMAGLKKTLRMQIIEPFLRPSLFERFKKQGGGGILLYGPPGCGKTMMARAVASECNASFISVGISDVLNMWMGESERNLAQLFEKARAQRPCVLFFDELDALAFARSKAQSEHSRTIVNEFLAQMDGVQYDNKNVLFLGATNMPWDVDSAMKRPGRFARQIFVSPPDLDARRHIIEMKLRGVPSSGIDADALARATEHYSGADVDGLLDLAKEHVIHDILEGGAERPIGPLDIDYALEMAQPSTLDWLRTARNLVRYAGNDGSFKDVEQYLKAARLL